MPYASPYRIGALVTLLAGTPLTVVRPLVAQATAGSTTPTIDQAVEMQSVSTPQMSPDGRRVVYEVQHTNWEENAFERALWIADVGTGQPHQLTAGKKSSKDAHWSPDGRWIAFLSDRPGQLAGSPDGKPQLYMISPDGGEAVQLTTTEKGVEALAWSPDSRHIAHVTEDSEPKYLKDRGARYGDYAVVHADYVMHHLWVIDLPAAPAPEARPARRLTSGSDFTVVAADGGTPRLLTDAFDENAALVAWNRDGIYFGALHGMQRTLYRLDVATRTAVPVSTTEHLNASAFSFSADFTHVAYVADRDNEYGEIYATALGSWRPTRLTAMGDQLNGLQTARREIVSWTSTDGTHIEGVLLEPVDFDPHKKYPLLVVIHGGPTGTDRPGITADRYYPIERFVAAGALVLRPNYRGSAGYGAQFRALNVRNLGLGDYADVISGVDALIAKGFVDKDRMGAMGWSQGGYISAFISASSDRFQAVSVGAGISDWMTYYVNTDVTPFTPQYLHATPWDDPEIYKKTSPISYIAKARTPTLIQHGELDRRVPIANAYELREALEDRGVPVKMVVFKGFGHGIDKPKQQRALMEENEQWFTQYVLSTPGTASQSAGRNR